MSQIEQCREAAAERTGFDDSGLENYRECLCRVEAL